MGKEVGDPFFPLPSSFFRSKYFLLLLRLVSTFLSYLGEGGKGKRREGHVKGSLIKAA